MYRIKLQSGEESEFSSFEELCFGIVSGIIGPDDEIYHAKACKWLPIESHPHYQRAAAQAPPPTPAMASPSSAAPSGAAKGHESPEEEAGQDLMTLLDLEEAVVSDPGKLQELAPAPEAESEARLAELDPIEAKAPDALETNGHSTQDHPEADQLDEQAATAEDSTEFEVLDPSAEMEAVHESDDAPVFEPSSDDEQPAEEARTAELDVTEDSELGSGDETAEAEPAIPEDDPVAELHEHDSDTDEVDEENTESGLDDVDVVATDSSGAIYYVATEHQDDDADEVDNLDDVDVATADGSRDMDYVASEHQDDDADEVDDLDETVVDEEPVAESAPSATLEVQGEVIEEPADLDGGDTDEDLETVEDEEPVAESAPSATLEVQGEVVEEAVDLDGGDTDEDLQLGGRMVELDSPMEDPLSDVEPVDEVASEEELVVAAEVADPIDSFQPDMDDDLFAGSFGSEGEVDDVRRFPVLPVAIAAGAVVMAILGWVLMGPSASDEPDTVQDDPAPATSPATAPPAATVPRASAGLVPEPVTTENSAGEMQRRYSEAYSRARSRLDADLRRTGFAAVFAPGNFASKDAMITARAAIAGASLAVTAYAGREVGIRDDFPDADPTGRERRVHREMAEDLLAVSRRIYDLLLANGESFSIRTGGVTITTPAVESDYAGLLSEVNRLMSLAATVDEEQAATIRRVASAVGATRPPALAELPPPPTLPTDL